MVEFPTSAAKDVVNLVLLRNLAHRVSLEQRYLLMLPVEMFKPRARSHEPEKGAEGNSVRAVQVVVPRFGAVRDILNLLIYFFTPLLVAERH